MLIHSSNYSKAYLVLLRNSEQPPEVFYKKVVFKYLQYLQENTYVGVSFQ